MFERQTGFEPAILSPALTFTLDTDSQLFIILFITLFDKFCHIFVTF